MFETVYSSKFKYLIPLFFASIFVSLFLIYFLDYELDDFLIYSQYIKNISDGNGFVFNLNEKVNGVSSILFLSIAVLVNFFIQNPLYSQYIVSIVAITGVFISHFYYSEKKLSIFSFLFFAFTILGFRYTYNLMGMETTLYLFLFLSILYCIDLEKKQLLPYLFLLIVLTRVEGFFLLFSYLLIHFNYKKPFDNFKTGLVPLLGWLIYLLFNFLYFGEALPQSGVAKILHGKSVITDYFPVSFTYLYLQYEWFLSFVSYLWRFFILLTLIGLFTYQNQKLKAIILLNLTITISFYVLNNIHNYSWYYSSIYFSIIFLAVLGFEKIIKLIKQLKSRYIKFGFASILGVISVLIFLKLFSILPYKVRDNDFKEYKKVALWIKENTSKDAKIASFEIGIVGFYSERYIIDFMGLVQKHNALSISQNKFTEWYSRHKPDYILLHYPAWTPYEEIANSEYFKEFEEVKELELIDLKLYKKSKFE
jgi:arabinofuranosyltransferase